MILYHITPIENLESILEDGLKVWASRTSDQYEPLGIYLSSNWIELLASTTFPEIFDYKQVAILEVSVPEYGLIPDPEYPNENIKTDPYIVRVAPFDICPFCIEHIFTLDLYRYPYEFIQERFSKNEHLMDWILQQVILNPIFGDLEGAILDSIELIPTDTVTTNSLIL